MTNNVLYPVYDFDINLESKTENKPEKPLTNEEFEKVKEEVLENCIKAYVSRMRASGLTNSRTHQDLKNDAYVAFCNFALNKFDKAKCGKIADENYRGKKKPKKVSWYFYHYFCASVNGISRDYKKAKKRRMGDSSSDNIGVDAEAIEDSKFHSALNVKELMDVLNGELGSLSPEGKELFRLRIVEGYSVKEAEGQIENFRLVNNEVQEFLNAFVLKHREMAAEIFNSRAENYVERINRKSRKKKTDSDEDESGEEAA